MNPTSKLSFRARGILALAAAAVVGSVANRPVIATAAGADAPSLRSASPNPATGSSAAVIVSGFHLAHTAQVTAAGPDGKFTDAGDVARQSGRCLELIDSLLKEADSGLDKIAKLHICVTKPEHVSDVQQLLGLRFSAGTRPAVTYVVSAPTIPGALVMMDAVGATEKTPKPNAAGLIASKSLKGLPTAGVSILPAKTRSVYISGQSAAGDLTEGARRTMERLKRTLDFLLLKPQHVVQLKAFMSPITNTAPVLAEVAKIFGTNQIQIPPVVFVEWTAPNSIEIEMIATTGDQSAAVRDSLSYVTPPGFTPSPLFSRVAVLNHGPTVYVGGLHAAAGGDASTQIREIFGALDTLLREIECNPRHMLKATYYVTDEKASNELNALPPGFLDSKRLPAASKVMVRGVAPGRTVTMDVIATTIR
ncbi:MAG: hypothetical protein FJ386_14835 [Verrucomicrobia bacterium]|nr:hypothetical protein [Verrucomicrobiota bacterium]